jgi:hypothetical protein
LPSNAVSAAVIAFAFEIVGVEEAIVAKTGEYISQTVHSLIKVNILTGVDERVTKGNNLVIVVECDISHGVRERNVLVNLLHICMFGRLCTISRAIEYLFFFKSEARFDKGTSRGFNGGICTLGQGVIEPISKGLLRELSAFELWANIRLSPRRMTQGETTRLSNLAQHGGFDVWQAWKRIPKAPRVCQMRRARLGRWR